MHTEILLLCPKTTKKHNFNISWKCLGREPLAEEVLLDKSWTEKTTRQSSRPYTPFRKCNSCLIAFRSLFTISGRRVRWDSFCGLIKHLNALNWGIDRDSICSWADVFRFFHCICQFSTGCFYLWTRYNYVSTSSYSVGYFVINPH